LFEEHVPDIRGHDILLTVGRDVIVMLRPLHRQLFIQRLDVGRRSILLLWRGHVTGRTDFEVDLVGAGEQVRGGRFDYVWVHGCEFSGCFALFLALRV
jgi:hypothetical protein